MSKQQRKPTEGFFIARKVMIKANELRIGNLITNLGTTEGVTPFVIAKIAAFEAEGKELGQFKPIPITEDWLLKAGFEIALSGPKITHYNKAPLWVTNSGGENWLYLANQKHVDLFFLHQLQNLYFALTGQELEFKE